MQADPQLTDKVVNITARALVDETFRDSFFADRDAALRDEKLTPAERATLDDITKRSFDQVVASYHICMFGRWPRHPSP